MKIKREGRLYIVAKNEGKERDGASDWNCVYLPAVCCGPLSSQDRHVKCLYIHTQMACGVDELYMLLARHDFVWTML
jgi:hypothetical protein